VIAATKLGDEPASNLYYSSDDANITKGYALVIAPRYSDMSKEELKTAKYPYEECLFFFSIDLSAAPPNHYPNAPPHFKHETPAIKNYRLHPNLYETSGGPQYSGKVCLGILGTWGNNDWNSSMSISDVLQGIMGILEANPGTYEPGCGSFTDKNAQGVLYNRHVLYESIDVTCKVYEKVINALPSTLNSNSLEFSANNIKKAQVPPFLEPFLEPLAKRAYSALSFLINKVDEFIATNGSTLTLADVMHHQRRVADFAALKKCLEAVKAKIPASLRKNVFKYGQGEIWRALYELSKPKINGKNMSYEEFVEEMEAKATAEKEKKKEETGKTTCRTKNNNNNNNVEYVYENEDEEYEVENN
jgi:ubiquitin-protein ligase